MPTHVVTAFLRNDTAILLLCRSEEVGSYQGQWSGVAGHVEAPDPSTETVDAQAMTEIAEETGLEDSVTLLRRGDTFTVQDPAHNQPWVVHPRLYECSTRTVDPNYETTTWEWVAPPEILRRDTVPQLWDSYTAVSPSVETIAGDDEHGSAYLSIRALEVLRDNAALATTRGDPIDFPALARDLRDSRPGMAAVRNRINRVMYTAKNAGGIEDPRTIERSATDAIATALDADDRAATHATTRLSDRVVTWSYSGTVETTLREATSRVVLAPSHPGGEGLALARTLQDTGVTATLTPDATLPGVIEATDTVLVGADTITAAGTVANKVGTYPLALAADAADADCYVVCAADKITPTTGIDLSEAATDQLDAPPDVAVHNPLLEQTPATYFDAIITEWGPLTPTEIEDLATDFATLATWENTE